MAEPDAPYYVPREGGATVLIAVADQPLCDAITNSLALAIRGVHLVMAATSREALATLRAESIDVVLADLDAPGAMAIEVLREARRSAPSARRVLIGSRLDLEKPAPGLAGREAHAIVARHAEMPDLVRIVAEQVGLAERAAEAPPEPIWTGMEP
ncbi:MAG: hypothetical protein LC620_02060 [Halobacteriales archaeon]|nr:hypothetical protein [Halobacteriales archaeon]